MTDNEKKTPAKILAERRLHAEETASIRFHELLEKEPEYAACEKELSELARKMYDVVLSKDTALASETEKRMNILVEREKTLLISKGYGIDYLKPDYFCKKCNDTGMITVDDKQEKCTCYRQLLLDTWRSESGLNIKDASFDKFDVNLYPVSERKNAADNLAICRNFVDNFSAETSDLVFTGKAGLGKTFLCSCIASSLICKDIPVMYISAFRLFSIVMSYDNDNREYAKLTEDFLRKTPVLIIDDLGAEKSSEAKVSFLLDILNDRECNNSFFPCKTIISTNLSPSDIFNVYGERIGSRILGRFNILKFAGDDIRLMKKT